MTFADILPLANRAALWVALKQDALQEKLDALGSWEWFVEPGEELVKFHTGAAPGDVIETRGYVIASIAPGPRSLLWGWSMPNVPADGPARELRQYGEEHGIESFTQDELKFPDLDAADVSDFVAQAAMDVGMAACEVLGKAPFFAPTPNGSSRAVIVLEMELEPLTVMQTVTKLPRLLDESPLRDARTSVWGLAKHEDWSLTWQGDNFEGAVLSDGVTAATFTFDERARITHISAEAA